MHYNPVLTAPISILWCSVRTSARSPTGVISVDLPVLNTWMEVHRDLTTAAEFTRQYAQDAVAMMIYQPHREHFPKPITVATVT